MPSVTFSGTEEVTDAVRYDVNHVSLDDGETNLVCLTVNIWSLEASVNFRIEQAEEFIVQFRDETVRAKQAQLEYQTDTDPETGVDTEVSQ